METQDDIRNNLYIERVQELWLQVFFNSIDRVNGQLIGADIIGASRNSDLAILNFLKTFSVGPGDEGDES